MPRWKCPVCSDGTPAAVPAVQLWACLKCGLKYGGVPGRRDIKKLARLVA